MEKDFSKLEKKLKIKFKNRGLLIQALVHRSYLNENPNFYLDHNERLEFLGDAVLELVVTEYLFKNYKNPEGELTNWRAALVRAESLSSLARKLGLEDYLYLSKGEAKSNGKARDYILANAFEALIGAVYLDQGLEKAKFFIEKNLIKSLANIIKEKLYLDTKTRFQEEAQARFKITPSYKVLSERGPDHAKIFKVGVYLNKELVATGEGSSKQEAELKAADEALRIKDW